MSFATHVTGAGYVSDVGDAPADWHTGAAIAAELSGPQAIGALLAVPVPTTAGDVVPAFGGDFFDRIHYSAKLIDLGNVISAQTITLNVWNAHRRAERLNTVTPINADGLSLTGGPPTTPYPFPALREVEYSISVTTDGPGTIDATYAFDWQTEDDEVRIVGTRIIAWTFTADWSSGILERFEWRTDVLAAFNGEEQRRALRIGPRKTVEFDAFFTGRERRYAEATLWGWGARTWALPFWPR